MPYRNRIAEVAALDISLIVGGFVTDTGIASTDQPVASHEQGSPAGFSADSEAAWAAWGAEQDSLLSDHGDGDIPAGGSTENGTAADGTAAAVSTLMAASLSLTHLRRGDWRDEMEAAVQDWDQQQTDRNNESIRWRPR